MRRRTLALAVTVLVLPCAAAVALAQDENAGPSARSLPSGRVLRPQGQVVPLGSFPVGGAVTPDGRFAWSISILRRTHELRIVSVERRSVVQTLRLPDATGGIVMDPRRRRAYLAFSDGIRAYAWNRASGRAKHASTYSLPRPPGHPGDTSRRPAFAGRPAITPDGRTLLVPLSLADTAVILDTRTRRTAYVGVGSHPYGAAILRSGRVGLVSNEGSGTVTAINLRRGTRIANIQVGANRSHPLGLALDPRADRAYVPIAHADQVVVIDTRRLRVERALSVGRPEGLGTMPVDVATSRDGTYLLAAEAGADEMAVFRLPRPGRRPTPGAFRLLGRIPVADYPVSVASAPVPRLGCRGGPRPPRPKPTGRGGRPVRTPKLPPATTQRCERIVWIATKGFGSTPNPQGPTPYRVDSANGDQAPSQIVTGVAGVLAFPSDRRIRALTAIASSQVRPSNPQSPPAGTPLRGGGPIRHVFFIVRENRTYDQVLGDVPRGNGDPQLTLFGAQVTPNVHALVQRFPLLDAVRANSETSIDGHLWTTAARVSDFVQRNWIQTYDPNGRPSEVFNSIRWPANGFLFDQADRQSISYFNYGESIAGTVEVVPDPDLGAADAAQRANRAQHSDLGPPAGCFPASLYVDRSTGRRVWDSSAVAGVLQVPSGGAARRQRRAGVQLHDPPRGPHPGDHAGLPHAASARRAERLRPGSDRRRDLPFPDLARDGDLRRGGRLPERGRPRRRPPHSDARDLPLREVRRRRAQALRPRVGHPLDGAHPGHAAAGPDGRAGHADVRRVLRRSRQLGAVRCARAELGPARDQSSGRRARPPARPARAARGGRDPAASARRRALALRPRPALDATPAGTEREPGRIACSRLHGAVRVGQR
jgi:YVTN family beta-propeller protein